MADDDPTKLPDDEQIEQQEGGATGAEGEEKLQEAEGVTAEEQVQDPAFGSEGEGAKDNLAEDQAPPAEEVQDLPADDSQAYAQEDQVPIADEQFAHDNGQQDASGTPQYNEQQEVSASNSSGLPIRQYLDTTVVPVLRLGLRELVKARPADPFDFLADFIRNNKPR